MKRTSVRKLRILHKSQRFFRSRLALQHFVDMRGLGLYFGMLAHEMSRNMGEERERTESSTSGGRIHGAGFTCTVKQLLSPLPLPDSPLPLSMSPLPLPQADRACRAAPLCCCGHASCSALMPCCEPTAHHIQCSEPTSAPQ